MEVKEQMKAKCIICGVEGKIIINKTDDSLAICEFCYINMCRETTADETNAFYFEG